MYGTDLWCRSYRVKLLYRFWLNHFEKEIRFRNTSICTHLERENNLWTEQPQENFEKKALQPKMRNGIASKWTWKTHSVWVIKDTLREKFHMRSFSGPYFIAFGQNTERYPVSLLIQFECEKIRTRKTPNTGNFNAMISSGKKNLYW